MHVFVLFSLLSFTPVRWTVSAGTNLQDSFKIQCPQRCTCNGDKFAVRTDCSAGALKDVPKDLSEFTTHLDLSMNQLIKIEDYAFSNLKSLIELRLSGNGLTSLPHNAFTGVLKLEDLHLQGNNFTDVPTESLKSLNFLKYLHLDANQISHISKNSFKNLHSLKNLWLDANKLTTIPSAAFDHLDKLEALTLAVNKITSIQDDAFHSLTNLGVLLLHSNNISKIADKAFSGLDKLRILELHRNHLDSVPKAIKGMKDLQELSLDENNIHDIPDYAFSKNSQLFLLQLKDNPIRWVGKYSFVNLTKLEKIELPDVTEQTVVPDFTGTPNIEILTLTQGKIISIPESLCNQLPRLKTLILQGNRISRIENMSNCKSLLALNLGNNDLRNLEGSLFQGMYRLHHLTLSYNKVNTLSITSFQGLTGLKYMDLSKNEITYIDESAFKQQTNLEELNLADNYFPKLPTQGLTNLVTLKTENNLNLMDFPDARHFPKARLLKLSYSYHCCGFINGKHMSEVNRQQWTDGQGYDLNVLKNASDGFLKTLGNLSEFSGEVFNNHYYKAANVDGSGLNMYGPIKCSPMPDSFTPCHDLLTWWCLRCAVWAIMFLAIVGNLCVMIILILSQRSMKTSGFLIMNLTTADLCMAVYLGFLAIVDASTFGDFGKHALEWQTSIGCQVAGFLAMFSCELSVFTVTTISMERCYAVSNTSTANHRLSRKKAGCIMVFGWLFALTLASLPLAGVNDYRKFSICLPFQIENGNFIDYVTIMALINLMAFIVCVVSYVHIYCSRHKAERGRRKDIRVAKHMALIVFTDFASWIPICFLTLCASLGQKFISLEDAKIFTLFVLPFNSCANPFLYAILTKQFRREFTNMCSRLRNKNTHHTTDVLLQTRRSISSSSSQAVCLIDTDKQQDIESTNMGDSDSGIVDISQICCEPNEEYDNITTQFGTECRLQLLGNLSCKATQVSQENDNTNYTQDLQIYPKATNDINALWVKIDKTHTTPPLSPKHCRHLCCRNYLKKKASDILSSPKRLLSTCATCTNKTGPDYEIMCSSATDDEYGTSLDDIRNSKSSQLDQYNKTLPSRIKATHNQDGRQHKSNFSTYNLWCENIPLQLTRKGKSSDQLSNTGFVGHNTRIMNDNIEDSYKESKHLADVDDIYQNSFDYLAESMKKSGAKFTMDLVTVNLLSLPGNYISRQRDSGYSMSESSSNNSSINTIDRH